MPWDLRTALTSMLKSLRDVDMVYAILFSGRRIITFVEPQNLSLHVNDMLLVLDWCNTALSVSFVALSLGVADIKTH